MPEELMKLSKHQAKNVITEYYPQTDLHAASARNVCKTRGLLGRVKEASATGIGTIARSAAVTPLHSHCV
jgi:hypothetical protein